MIGENTLLLNEFITHYKNLRVDRFHFIVHDLSEELPQHPDTDYLIKVFNHLKDLGYINTQYEFSEQFLGKNNCAKKNSLGNCFSA